MIENVSQLCTLDNALNLSSHDLITADVKLSFAQPKLLNSCKTSYSPFKRRKISWDASRFTQYQLLANLWLTKAVNYWTSLESIPLLITLSSKLLVTSAELTFKSILLTYEAREKKPSKILARAENNLNMLFYRWKKESKPSSDTSNSKMLYIQARAELQRLRRREENMRFVSSNNTIMHLDQTNRSMIFKTLKTYMGTNKTEGTQVLHTPIGSYYGEDVLEGFAADAEYIYIYKLI